MGEDQTVEVNVPAPEPTGNPNVPQAPAGADVQPSQPDMAREIDKTPQPTDAELGVDHSKDR